VGVRAVKMCENYLERGRTERKVVKRRKNDYVKNQQNKIGLV